MPQRHLNLLRCSVCQGELTALSAGLRCTSCDSVFSEDSGLIDFAPSIPRDSSATQPARGQRWMEDPKRVGSYETRQRTLFVRAMGRTWGKGFTPDIEDAYLVRQVAPAEDGVVLDVACGAGRWTRTLEQRFGPDRVIGLDLSFAMLALAQRVVPSIALLRGSAMTLPFADHSLGAVNCWNAIQALPDPPNAIREMSRVLKLGGSLTCLTYLESRGPYRWVQGILQRQVGSIIAPRDTFLGWVRDADLTVEELTVVGQVVMLTARRS